MTIVVIGVCVTALVLLVWWLFFETEGVYLGRRVVIWLYDLYAGRYDAIVQQDDIGDHVHLAQPIMAKMHPHTDPLVLDVATGTGRLPLALCQHARFEGQVIGLDLSRKMLAQAAQKLTENHFEDYVTFVWADGLRLPFSDDNFDLVSCLEALEFMPDQRAALAEWVRVLRPGGVLLTTQRINIRTMPGKVWDAAQIEQALRQLGIEQIEFEAWQHDYTKVWGIKAGSSDFIGIRSTDEILRCPHCAAPMIGHPITWVCEHCGRAAPISVDGVIELFPLQATR